MNKQIIKLFSITFIQRYKMGRPDWHIQTIFLHSNPRHQAVKVLKIILRKLNLVTNLTYAIVAVACINPVLYFLLFAFMPMKGVTSGNTNVLKNWRNNFFGNRLEDFSWNSITTSVEKWVKLCQIYSANLFPDPVCVKP